MENSFTKYILIMEHVSKNTFKKVVESMVVVMLMKPSFLVMALAFQNSNKLYIL